MKKFLILILVSISLHSSLAAQDFGFSNPVMTPSPGTYPGGTETVSFEFSVDNDYTFSNNSANNNYATITFSFTKLDPTSSSPTGTGSTLFNWVLTNNGISGTGRVYTWTGTTQNITMLSLFTQGVYPITFSNVSITFPATMAESDLRVAAVFTDPAGVSSNQTNNNAVVSTYTTAAVPVTITNFAVSPKNCDVAIHWNFHNQVNSDYTEVEQSSDGISFSPVYRIQFNGRISGFQTAKVTQVNGAGYYRLKITDNDGRIQYSEVKSAKTNCGKKQKLEVFPTALGPNTVVLFNTTEAKGISTLTLMDIYGRKLITKEVTILQGSNQMSLNSASISAGSYYVRIEGKGWKSEVVKVVKSN